MSAARRIKKLARPPHTWGEIKAMIQIAGVRDADPVYELDLGPFMKRVAVDRSEGGVEIGEESWVVPGVEE